MTPERKIAEDIFHVFAYKDTDGNWWGHDTDLGKCEKAYILFEQALISHGNKRFEEGLDKAARIATEIWLESRLIPGAEYPVNLYSWSVQDAIRSLLKKEEKK